jgi:hypothetical protein
MITFHAPVILNRAIPVPEPEQKSYFGVALYIFGSHSLAKQRCVSRLKGKSEEKETL